MRFNFGAVRLGPAVLATLLLSALLGSATSVAQEGRAFPNEPIRIIVPFGPASGPDFADPRVASIASGRHQAVGARRKSAWRQ